MSEHDVDLLRGDWTELDRDGLGYQSADLPTLLALLAAGQRLLPTVQAMRGGGANAGLLAADRIVRLFAPCAQGSPVGGAFNRQVARHLAGARDGEDDVYREA